ncbi:hypothetical protein PFISCL1PPCAC_7944 [Pristionchus fissidentatus]|uniref:Transmembrane protein n=1 Tax=Pristionchus fissidentatus TaxID=1538716 RepID=A0AAV5VER5_9BILA|nr:hypothetical protein PFISCL1PPCAC_7944 [Pristionchus fissidentatus]
MASTGIFGGSVTEVSQIAAVVSVAVWVIVLALAWLWGELPIFLSVFVSLHLVATLYVFVACRKQKAVLVIPIIALEVLAVGMVIRFAVNYFLYEFGDSALWYSLYKTFLLFGGTLASSFFVYCHISCYKLLRSEETEKSRNLLVSQS